MELRLAGTSFSRVKCLVCPGPRSESGRLPPAGASRLRSLDALLILGLSGAASLLGCGSRAEAGDSPIAPGPGGQLDDTDGMAADELEPEGNPPDGPDPDSLGFETTELPDCEPGFRRSRAGGRSCLFVHDRLCYEDPVMACACACPDSGSSVCVFGGLFSPPDEPVPVSCS